MNTNVSQAYQSPHVIVADIHRSLAMAMKLKLSALLVTGEMICLRVSPEMKGKELKKLIKEGQPWDEVTRTTTRVEIVVGDRLLCNDEKVSDAGLADLVVSAVFKPNTVSCSNKDALASFEGDIDPELWLILVVIPDKECHIPEKAFEGCNKFQVLTIHDSVTHIGNRAFAKCRSLASLTIPNSVTRIGDFAFGDCSSLASLTIPNSVKHIGNSAFANCSSLASLAISESVTHIANA